MLSDQHFRQRLSCIEENLLTSIANGTLNSFQRSWTSLFNDFSKATSQLDPATVAIAHTVASNVFAITDCYSSMQCRQEELSTKLHDDWDRILGDASQTHNISPKESIPLTDHSPTISSNDSSLPTFVPLAYTWLLQNLHHPYPSLETKSSIAAKSNGSLSSIGAWFTSVRRRMGWTAICRNHFRNCRTDTLDAAYRALVKEDPERRLSSEITQAFMEMKVTTECLYSSIFTRSALANDLDGVVGDVATCSMSTPLQAKESPDKLGPTSGSGMHQASYRYLSSKRDTSIQRSELYPERSWSPSSVTSSLNNDEYSDEAIDDEATSVTPARNKRRLSTSDLLDGVQYKDSCRPIKRLRYASFHCHAMVYSYPYLGLFTIMKLLSLHLSKYAVLLSPMPTHLPIHVRLLAKDGYPMQAFLIDPVVSLQHLAHTLLQTPYLYHPLTNLTLTPGLRQVSRLYLIYRHLQTRKTSISPRPGRSNFSRITVFLKNVCRAP